MFTEEVVEFIFREFFWIALVLSVLIMIFSPTQIRFEGHVHKVFNKWITLVSAAIGWLCIYVFIVFFDQRGGADISFNHILLLIMGILGVAGFLPNTLTAIVNSLQKLIEKTIDKV